MTTTRAPCRLVSRLLGVTAKFANPPLSHVLQSFDAGRPIAPREKATWVSLAESASYPSSLGAALRRQRHADRHARPFARLAVRRAFRILTSSSGTARACRACSCDAHQRSVAEVSQLKQDERDTHCNHSSSEPGLLLLELSLFAASRL
jgi:hypothetical protein